MCLLLRGRRFHVRLVDLDAGSQRRGHVEALEILAQVGDSALLSGKNPVSLAAASLYLATIETSEYTTQLRIAIAADVSTVTVRKRCLEIIQLVKEGNSQLLTKSIEKSRELLSEDVKQVPQHVPEEAQSEKNVKGLFIASRQITAIT